MDMEPVRQPQKFCKHCGGKIPADAVICTLCGRQVEGTQPASPSVVIDHADTNENMDLNQMHVFLHAPGDGNTPRPL